MATLKITQVRHPDYRQNIPDWYKWRLSYEGGRAFINSYLVRFSKREDPVEFAARKAMTYCPRFAGGAIDDVKNSIYQRMADITRNGGDKTYQQAIIGKQGGVDLRGNNMNRFMGQFVLPELLINAKVGIYVDMPAKVGPTLASNKDKKPYLYYYCAEDIANWAVAYDDGDMFYTDLLLKESEFTYDEATGMPKGKVNTYRHYTLVDDGVEVEFLAEDGQRIGNVILLKDMPRIPFVCLETTKSLMEDICDYQIALMNLESSDINYMTKSNFPFYVEQYDPRSENTFGRPGTEQEATDALKRKEAVVGPMSGRRYPKETNPPQFIHPSPEPIQASMAKEAQIKQDIRKLLNLSLSNLEPKFASADSKGMDDRSLEAGLASLGLVLQFGEQQVAEIWAAYIAGSTATVNYPRSYSLKSEGERREEAKNDAELMAKVPSVTYQKSLAKKIANTMVGHVSSPEDMDKIYKEIDDASYISSDPEAIAKDLENGLVSDKTASQARGYAEGEVEAAKADHAARIQRIQQAQAPGGLTNPAARGVNDLNPAKGNAAAKEEKSGTVQKPSGNNA